MDRPDPRVKPTERAIERVEATTKRKKGPPPRNPLNPISAMMILAGIVDACVEAHSLGASEQDLRKFASDWAKNLERQYDLKSAEQLPEPERWRKGDVPKLAQLLLRPGLASPEIQHRIAELIDVKDSSGRGVIPEPKKCDQAFVESIAVLQRIVDPATSAKERRELRRKYMPKYPDRIEAAYRGERERVRGWTPDKNYPYMTASQRAEHNVAVAAGISEAQVHQLCQQVRDELRCAAAAGRLVEPEPAMTAAELKRQLVAGPAEPAKLSKP
jgi:hypothetical protein